MKGIQKNLIVIIVLGIILSAIVSGFTSIISFISSGKGRSEEILSKELEIRASFIDNLCMGVEKSVHGMSEQLKSDMPATDRFLEKEGIAYMEQAKVLARAFVSSNDKLAAVYYRLNPEIADSKSGFFMSKTAKVDEIIDGEPTDLSLYAQDDAEHVAWYYEPKEAGKAIWVSQYMNLNNGILTISYVAPMYAEDGTFVGVLGVDIDMKKLYQELSSVNIYEKGFASLMGADGEIRYSPEDIYITEAARKKIISEETTTTSYIQRQKRMTLLSKRLIYGDYLLISIDNEDLYINENRVILSIVLITMFVSILIMLLLTGLINTLFQRFKTDVLTKTNNRNAYMEEIEEIEEQIQARGKGFSIVVFDVNGLKYVNDHKGHAAGDEMIQNAAKEIQRFFPKEKLYRIGGDEFVILRRNGRYPSLSFKLQQFEEEMKRKSKNRSIEENVLVISSGMSSFFEGKDACYDDVFHRADRAMYANKAEFYKENPELDRRNH